MVMPVPARQDPCLVPRQELRQRHAVPRGFVEQARIEHVRQGVESRVVGQEHGVGVGRVVGEAVPLQDAAVEEGLQKPRVGAVPRPAAWVSARPEPVVGERLAGRGRGGRRGRVGEREGVGPAVAEEVGVEARRQAADVDPPAYAWVRPVGAGGDAEEGEEDEEGINHFWIRTDRGIEERELRNETKFVDRWRRFHHRPFARGFANLSPSPCG